MDIEQAGMTSTRSALRSPDLGSRGIRQLPSGQGIPSDKNSAAVTRQEEKSGVMRARIMDAALRCVAQIGYTRTTTQLIAQTAEVSRGALMHHFVSRDNLKQATIEHLHARRLQEFRMLVAALSRKVEGAADITQDVMRETVNLTWEYYRVPTFAAFQELRVAARTEPPLAKLIGQMEGPLVARSAGPSTTCSRFESNTPRPSSY